MGQILCQIFKTILRIFKKNHEKLDNPSIKRYVSKIEKRIIFKIKTGYYLELLTYEAMNLLGSTENKKTKDKNVENVPHLEITQVVLVHCNIVNKDYQQVSRLLYTFVLNKPFGNLLEIAPKNLISLNTLNSEFQTIEVWITDQNCQPLRKEGRVNVTLVIK